MIEIFYYKNIFLKLSNLDSFKKLFFNSFIVNLTKNFIMPEIVFFNASSGESKKLDLTDLKKEDAYKAFKEVITSKKKDKENKKDL